MSDFKIDRAVPIPDERNSYPLNAMAVGDSFTFPLDKRQSVQTTASRLKQIGKEFRVRKISDDECRIWRSK